MQLCVNTLLSEGGLSAYQTVVGSDQVNLYVWRDGDIDLDFAQDVSISAVEATDVGSRGSLGGDCEQHATPVAGAQWIIRMYLCDCGRFRAIL